MPKKRDRFEQKLKLLFTNRAEELNTFRQFIQGVNDYELLHVQGIPGIGKTALLEAYSGLCKEHGIPCVQANVGDRELPAQLVRSIYDELTQRGLLTLPNLQARYRRYDQLDQQVRSNEDIPPEVLSVILTGMTTLTGHGAEDTGQEAQQALNFLPRILGGADADFYLNPTPYFTESLLIDLEQAAQQQRICLMFDRYERISPYLDEWILQVFPNLEDNILVVTSGRRPLPVGWEKWLPMVQVLDLEPLKNEITQALVRRRGVTDEAAVREIAKFSDGLPLAASMAVDLLRESGTTHLSLEGAVGPQAVVGLLVHKLTEDVPNNLHNWLEQCAVLHRFNEETLEHYIGIPQADVARVYEQLGGLSFVQPHPNGLALHDLVREFMGGDLAGRAPQRYRDLHRQAADYYEQLFTRARRQEAQPLAVELVYHLLRADQDRGMTQLRELFENATDFSQVEFSAALLETTRGLEIGGGPALWLGYFEGVYWQQRNVDNPKSARLLEALIARPGVEQYPELKARIAAYLAVVLWYIAEFPSALRYAELAVTLSQRLALPKFEARSLEALGLTYDRLGRFEQGIETQLALLKMTRQANDRMGEAWALNNLGYFSWHAGKWSQAEDYLLRCRALMLDLSSPYNLVYPLGHLGLLYVAVGRLKEAEAVLQESLATCQAEKNLEMESKTLQNLADLRHIQGRTEEALAYINTALKVNQALVHPYFDTDCYRRRGNYLVELGRYEEAAASYLEGLKLAEKLEAEYMRMHLLVALTILQLRGWTGHVPASQEQIVEGCHSLGYYHILSDLKFAQAVALSEAGKHGEGHQEFLEALIYGMLYNRYRLYKQLARVIDLVREWQARGGRGQGHQLLEALGALWRTGTYEGQALRELEKAARASEPGVVPLPLPLLEQLSSAVKALH